MLKHLFKQFLYVQLSPERVTVRDPKTGEAVSEIPEVAIQHSSTGKAKILAVGSVARAAASAPDIKVLNPFAHPRSLVSDFTVAEQVLKAFFGRVLGRSLLQLSPVVIVHPLGEQTGGLTQVEIRAFRELALGAGASQARVWQGPQLTDEQVMSGEYPVSGNLLSEKSDG